MRRAGMGQQGPQFLQTAGSFPGPLFFPCVGLTLSHIPTENITSSCTRGKESSRFFVAAGDVAEPGSQDCKACKGCHLLPCWDLSVCWTSSYYQKLLKWGETTSSHLSWAAPVRLLIFIHPCRRHVMSAVAFQRLFLSHQLEIPWHSLS